MELNTDQMEKVFEYLEANNIECAAGSAVMWTDDADIDLDVIISEEDDVDMENIGSVCPGGSQHRGSGAYVSERDR